MNVVYVSRYARSLSNDQGRTGSQAIVHNCTQKVDGFSRKVAQLLADAKLPSNMQIITNVLVKPCQHIMRYKVRLS